MFYNQHYQLIRAHADSSNNYKVDPADSFSHTDHREQSTNWKHFIKFAYPQVTPSLQKTLVEYVIHDIDRDNKYYEFDNITNNDETRSIILNINTHGFDTALDTDEFDQRNPMSYTDCFFNKNPRIMRRLIEVMKWKTVADQIIEINIGTKYTTVGFVSNKLLILHFGFDEPPTDWLPKFIKFFFAVNIAGMVITMCDKHNRHDLLKSRLLQLFASLRAQDVSNMLHFDTASPHRMNISHPPRLLRHTNRHENPDMIGTCIRASFARDESGRLNRKRLSTYIKEMFAEFETVEPLPPLPPPPPPQPVRLTTLADLPMRIDYKRLIPRWRNFDSRF